MRDHAKTFGTLFTKYRLKAEFITLSDFGKALSDEGLLYEDSIFSRWQRGNRVPRHRRSLLTIILVFVKKGGITTIHEANEFLESANQGYLTTKEEHEMFHKPMAIHNPMYMDSSLFAIADSNDKVSYIEGYVYAMQNLNYQGFASFAYKKYAELEKMIISLRLDETQRGKNLLTNIMCQKIQAFGNMAKIEELGKGLQEAHKIQSYARENNTAYQGPATRIIPFIERLALLAGEEKYITPKRVKDALAMTEAASSLMTTETFEQKISTHLEAALFSLIAKDKVRFDTEIATISSLLEKTPTPPAPYLSLLWNAKARGAMAFGESFNKTLEYVDLGKKYLDPKYQTVNLYLNNTRLQAFTTSNDPVYQEEGKKLQEQVRLEAKLQDNKYQIYKINNKRLIGV